MLRVQKSTYLRVLVCGDRGWKDKDLILDKLMELGPDNISLIIDGHARGADSLGNEAARQLKLKTMRFKADWQGLGKSAGPARNRRMLVEGKPDLVLAFHDNILASKGTKNMLDQARVAKVEIRLFSHYLEAERAIEKASEAFPHLTREQRLKLWTNLMDPYCLACGDVAGEQCHCNNEE